MDENYGKKKNSVQPNSMKNPQKPSVLKNLRFWRSFSIYKLVDIGNKFSTISSHRQRTGDPKFHHRGNIRCRFRWQWHFSEIRKFYHFSEWSPSSTNTKTKFIDENSFQTMTSTISVLLYNQKFTSDFSLRNCIFLKLYLS